MVFNDKEHGIVVLTSQEKWDPFESDVPALVRQTERGSEGIGSQDVVVRLRLSSLCHPILSSYVALPERNTFDIGDLERRAR